MPAETTNYLILGFAVTLAVLGVHLASFPIRIRNLRADLAALQASPGRKAAPKRKAAKRKPAVKRRR
jgi:hypothetical protein